MGHFVMCCYYVVLVMLFADCILFDYSVWFCFKFQDELQKEMRHDNDDEFKVSFEYCVFMCSCA